MRPRSALLALAAGLLFFMLATANSGGYRFGVSDQAFYIPAVEHLQQPDLFPRDGALLDAQSSLMATDEMMAAAVSWSGATLPHVALGLYVLTLVGMLAAATALGRGLGLSWWAVSVLGVLLTFRHRIAKTGANSLEGYMHPRQLAFAVGLGALAATVRGRPILALVLVGASGLLHPTTALWFAIVVIIATWVNRPSWRPTLAGLGLVASVAGVWAVWLGPLAGHLTVMDADWLSVFASKDYLFPADWPLDAWLLNLAYPVVIVAIWRTRTQSGVAPASERGLIVGLLALVAVFLLSVPFTMADVALAVQLQVTRVFWVLDAVAMVSLAWWMTRSRRLAIVALSVLTAASVARGYYLLEVAAPDRTLVRVDLAETPWVDAMTWLSRQPTDWNVLADPDHAWKYGYSLRVAALRDTVLETVKDSAIAIYNRDVARRVAERTKDTADYGEMTTERARVLDEKYALDVIVVEVARPLALPLLYRNAQFAIYDVR